jgi:hypothetical protein
MVPRASPAIPPNGSTAGASSISGAHRITPRRKQDRALASDGQNRVLLKNYYLPGALEAEVGAFVEHYNHARYHESLHNLIPADVLLRTRPNHHPRTGKDQTTDAACSTTRIETR